MKVDLPLTGKGPLMDGQIAPLAHLFAQNKAQAWCVGLVESFYAHPYGKYDQRQRSSHRLPLFG